MIKELMDEGFIEGELKDYYLVTIWPATPDNSQSFEGVPPYIVYVNPKQKSMINHDANREEDQKWRDKYFPKEFPKEWGLESIKERLELEKLPEDFFKALYASDLSSFAYKLLTVRPFLDGISKL